jgi:hypothetical protein
VEHSAQTFHHEQSGPFPFLAVLEQSSDLLDAGVGSI